MWTNAKMKRQNQLAENIQNFLSKFPTMCLGPKVKLLKVNPHEAHLNNDLLV